MRSFFTFVAVTVVILLCITYWYAAFIGAALAIPVGLYVRREQRRQLEKGKKDG